MRRNLCLSDILIGASILKSGGRRALRVSVVHIPVQMRAVVGGELSQLARVSCSMKCLSMGDVLSRCSLVAMLA